MQRNRTRQNALTSVFYAALFLVYEALAMQYLFLPPLLGILFFFHIRALDRQDTPAFALMVFLLLVLEAAKGYPAFSSVIFFTVSYFTVIPRLRNAVSCRLCLDGLIVLYAYLGYWFFLLLVSKMLAFAPPHLDWRTIFYIAIEFVVVGLL